MDFNKKDKTELVKELVTMHGKLAKSENKYRTLTRTLFVAHQDGLVFCSMDGKIEYANQTYKDMLGYTLDELRSLTYQQLTPERLREMESDLLKNQVLKRGFCDEYKKEE